VHHHSLPFIIILIGAAVFYAAREFILAGHSRWTELAGRYASSASPETPWQALSFLQMEMTAGRTIQRTVYRTRSFQGGLGTWIKERLFPTALVAVSKKGLHLKRQPWHFKHPALLIPWKTVSVFEVVEGTKFAASHAGTNQPAIGAAIQARMPKVLSAAVNGLVGDVAHFELKSPKLHLYLPADTLDDVTPYLSAPVSPVSPGSEASTPSAAAAAPRPVAVSSKSMPKQAMGTKAPKELESFGALQRQLAAGVMDTVHAIVQDPWSEVWLDLRVAPGGAPSGSLKVKFPSGRAVPIKPSAELVATMKQVLKTRGAFSQEAWSGMRLIVSQDGRCNVDFDYGAAAPAAPQAASS
jgi:hypothetical protein